MYIKFIKRIYIIFFLLLISISGNTQILRGKVVLQNSENKGLSDVQIVASDIVATVSDEEGNFLFDLCGYQEGQLIELYKIEKEGFAVVNQEEIDQWQFSSNKCFLIVMAPEAELQKSRARLYHLFDIRQKKNSEKKEVLRQQLKRNQISQEEFKRLYSQLVEENDLILRTQDFYVDKLARINKDQLSKVAVTALDSLEKGAPEQGTRILKKAGIYEKWKESVRMGKELTEDLEKMVPSLQSYADICVFAGGAENYRKAGDILHKIAMSDTTNINRVFAYAKLMEQMNNFEEAEIFYWMTLRNTPNDNLRANILNNLLNVYALMDNYDRAEECFKESWKLYFKILPETSVELMGSIALLQMNMALFHVQYNQCSDALSEFKISEMMYRVVIEYNSKRFLPHLAKMLLNLGMFYRRINDLPKALIKFEECKNIYQDLYQEMPDQYQNEWSVLLLYLGKLYVDMGMLGQAEVYLKDAIQMQRELMVKNPYAYGILVATSLRDLALLQMKNGEYELPENELKEALYIMKEYEDGSDDYCLKKAYILSDLGLCYSVLSKDHSECEKLGVEALDICRQLANKRPNQYEECLMYFWNNLGFIHLHMSKDTLAEYELIESLRLCRHFVEKDKERYNMELPKALLVLAKLHYRNKDFKKSEQEYLEIVKIYTRLCHEKKGYYEGLLALHLMYLGDFYSSVKSYKMAEHAYKKALKLYRILYIKNSEEFQANYADCLCKMGCVCWLQNKAEDAIVIFRQCQPLYKVLSDKIPLKYTQSLIDIDRLLNFYASAHHEDTQFIQEIKRNGNEQ